MIVLSNQDFDTRTSHVIGNTNFTLFSVSFRLPLLGETQRHPASVATQFFILDPKTQQTETNSPPVQNHSQSIQPKKAFSFSRFTLPLHRVFFFFSGLALSFFRLPVLVSLPASSLRPFSLEGP